VPYLLLVAACLVTLTAVLRLVVARRRVVAPRPAMTAAAAEQANYRRVLKASDSKRDRIWDAADYAGELSPGASSAASSDRR
jgi:hypothetical protein